MKGIDMRKMSFGDIWDISDAKLYIDEFFSVYKERPLKDNKGGMLSPHCFWVWYVCRKLMPKYIVESGVFKGQSTWLFRKTCPDTPIFSIDPALEQRVYIDDSVTYLETDFSHINWDVLIKDKKNTLLFFDDHQNAYNRLMQMNWMGFKRAIFEDNYPISQGDCYSINKALSCCGYHDVEPNEADGYYIKNKLGVCMTFPPLCRTEKTRWGDFWTDDIYPTDSQILDDEDIEKYPVFREEAMSYTWICYVELKED